MTMITFDIFFLVDIVTLYQLVAKNLLQTLKHAIKNNMLHSWVYFFKVVNTKWNVNHFYQNHFTSLAPYSVKMFTTKQSYLLDIFHNFGSSKHFLIFLITLPNEEMILWRRKIQDYALHYPKLTNTSLPVTSVTA